jgi:diguanylate cyclase (GGDEF)-like protein/hemerythrin-like metal-binding protein/PAS domain S-box-containing protein
VSNDNGTEAPHPDGAGIILPEMRAAAAKSSLALSWSEQLATGMPQIDHEHRGLIDLINDLGRLREQDAATEQLRSAIGGLRRYAVQHFGTEAVLMRKHRVDAAHRRAHLAAHRGFVKHLDSADALVTVDAPAVTDELLAYMVKWLVQHVSGVDANLVREINALNSGIAAPGTSNDEGKLNRSLIDTMSGLYDTIGARTFEMLQANQRLHAEIDRRQHAEGELRLAAKVFNVMSEAVMVTDAANRIIAVNPSFSRITGYSAVEAINADPRLLSSGLHAPDFYRDLWQSLLTTDSWAGEIRNRHKDGKVYVEWLSITRMRDEASDLIHHVAVFSDITERRLEADRIAHLAHHDLLTGLPNRSLFADRVRQALVAAQRDKVELAVMFLDLDRFKQINDTLGHAVGDLLLKAAATRMQGCLRASDTVARIGGDEFVVLLPVVKTAADAMLIAQSLRHALGQPFELFNHCRSISASIGIAVHPGHGDEEHQMLTNADHAMYRAKMNGGDAVELYRHGNGPGGV